MYFADFADFMFFAFILTSFLIGMLVRDMMFRSITPLFRKSAKLTPDEIASIRDYLMTSNNEYERMKLPYRIPKKYWNEVADEYVKFCIRTNDADKDDIIRILHKSENRLNVEAVSAAYHILAMNYVKGIVHSRNRAEWDKELSGNDNNNQTPMTK